MAKPLSISIASKYWTCSISVLVDRGGGNCNRRSRVAPRPCDWRPRTHASMPLVLKGGETEVEATASIRQSRRCGLGLDQLHRHATPNLSSENGLELSTSGNGKQCPKRNRSEPLFFLPRRICTYSRPSPSFTSPSHSHLAIYSALSFLW